MRTVKSKNLEKLSKFDVEKNTNESMLKPNLGHPNMQAKLEQLNKKEVERQATHQAVINSYLEELKSTVGQSSENFLKELSCANESMLLKFDELLTEDDVFKPGKNDQKQC